MHAKRYVRNESISVFKFETITLPVNRTTTFDFSNSYYQIHFPLSFRGLKMPSSFPWENQ